MNELDQRVCQDVLNELTSKKYEKKNYLFLDPVDPAYPGYSALVSTPMDLGTVRRKLGTRQYTSQAAFFSDVELVFNNAVLFHNGRKDTAHVFKLAKDMLKVVNKEKKKRMGTSKPKAGKTGLKLKLGGPSPSAAGTPSSAKPKLKLKVPTAPTDAVEKPKAKLKLSLSMKSKSSTSKVSSGSKAPTASKPSSSKANSTKAASTKAASTKVASTKAASTKVASTKAPKPPAPAAPPKIRLSVAGPRGKELPKGVAPAAAPAPPATTTAKPSVAKASTTKAKPKKQKSEPKPKVGKKAAAAASRPPPSGTGMTMDRKMRCMKVLSGIRRRQSKNVVWFTHPISDKAFVDDYKAQIPHPMDLGTMTSKLDKNQYGSMKEFALDLRRVFSNCLRFNTTKHDSFRPIAVQMLKTAEELMAHFLWKPEAPTTVYPPLMYCWELCIDILDRLLNVTNPGDDHQTAHFFLHPASYFFGGTFPADYLAKVSKPMDFGTITSKLVEGTYQGVAEFCSDCRLVITNCLTYYEEGNPVSGQATKLKELMKQQLDALARYDQSGKAQQARSSAVSYQNVRLAKPPVALLLSILGDLRSLQYTDKLTKLSQPAMRPFEKPVDQTMYRDYLQFVKTPMDVATVERKTSSGAYETPEDFEYDVHLIFRNCEAYNAPKKTEPMVAMGKYGAKEFKKLFTKRMRAHENPEDASHGTKRTMSPQAAGGKSAKRPKLDGSASSNQPRAPTPRISITAPSAEALAAAQKAKMKATGGRRKDGEGRPANQPVPLHIAIAEVKSRYPLKRHIKLLDEWETACAKFFKELMKHPWISAARPKFIYHVPVPVLFPELTQAYQAKVKKPMDLTSAEAKLLVGGKYYNPQDFTDDVALVFANAIAFNKAGRDEGDHLSIAYFDASIHLLKYARWLSLELLQKYLSDDPHPDEATPDGIPPSNWKLSSANRDKARKEMESDVFGEPIDRRESWHESELEKLLKSLRHQSDFRHMRYYIGPNYPPDYTAFIAKPMDWESVQRTLKRRQYAKFGDVVADLRLIFSNAIKYNGRNKDLDEVSEKAYESALYMSEKLEVAIDKMMLTVCERMGREKVDNSMEERETDAEDRAEEERIRAAMAAGGEGAANPDAQATKTETVETVRIVQRRQQQQRRDIDMELPFEDDGGNRHQSENEAQRQLKATYEQQKKKRTDLQALSASLGVLVYSRHDLCEQAKKWANEGKKPDKKATAETPKEADKEWPPKFGSAAAVEIMKAGRQKINMKLKPMTLPSKKKSTPQKAPISLE